MKLSFEIDLDDVQYRIEVLPEDVEIKGNALASGDADEDTKEEKRIMDELESGNEWAWCSVRVVAEIELPGKVFEGDAYLGCCSYEDEDDFKQDGYYEDMKQEAYDELVMALKHMGAK